MPPVRAEVHDRHLAHIPGHKVWFAKCPNQRGLAQRGRGREQERARHRERERNKEGMQTKQGQINREKKSVSHLYVRMSQGVRNTSLERLRPLRRPFGLLISQAPLSTKCKTRTGLGSICSGNDFPAGHLCQSSGFELYFSHSGSSMSLSNPGSWTRQRSVPPLWVLALMCFHRRQTIAWWSSKPDYEH